MQGYQRRCAYIFASPTLAGFPLDFELRPMDPVEVAEREHHLTSPPSGIAGLPDAEEPSDGFHSASILLSSPLRLPSPDHSLPSSLAELRSSPVPIKDNKRKSREWEEL